MGMFEFFSVALQWKTILVLFFILLALIPAYILNQFLQKVIRPRESLGRLFLYLISGVLTVFVFVAVLVFLIKLLFPEA
jgi:hypothetical protein